MHLTSYISVRQTLTFIGCSKVNISEEPSNAGMKGHNVNLVHKFMTPSSWGCFGHSTNRLRSALRAGLTKCGFLVGGYIHVHRQRF